jgi:hypothetical protein
MAMRVFIGFGYNERDAWIETLVFPILRALRLEILHGKDLHGEVLQDGVKQRIVQSDALIGFCTLRAGQEAAAFNTHPWVRDEIVFAVAQGKPIVEVRETGVNVREGILGDRQRITLRQDDRLGCVAELVQAVNSWSARALQMVPIDEETGKRLRTYVRDPQFKVRYRTRLRGVDSPFREAKVERIKGGLYLTAVGVPEDALVEIEGALNGQVVVSSGWESVDTVQVPVS